MRLTPILKPKVWGGRKLARFGKALPEGTAIGESWELADLPASSPDGGGGGEERSPIANGALAGRTLAEAIATWGRDLLGSLTLTAEGGFPLLVKFLDAREPLSVQVHPSLEYAAAHPECHLKSETWVVLDAEPGAVLYKGLRPGVTVRDLDRAVHTGTVLDCLQAVPAIVGECHDLPSGTVHALGAGIVVAEVQTPSDTTFRLWDWPGTGRTGRTLHVAQALACVQEGAPPPVTRAEAHRARARLAATAAYDLWELRAEPGERVEHPEPGYAPRVVVVLDGRVDADGYPMVAGDTAVLPACGAPGSSIAMERSRVLVAGFPAARE